MAHGYAVVYGYGVELGSIASHAFYLGLHYLAYLVQMSVPGYKLGKRIDDGYDGLAKHFPLHAIGHPQGAGACHTSPLGAYGTPKLVFHIHGLTF